jgi:uncharacterized protein YbaR (Trm112 family)
MEKGKQVKHSKKKRGESLPLLLPPPHRQTANSEQRANKVCVVCTEERDPHEFPQTAITRQCGHGSWTCSACISTSIRAQLDVKRWDDVGCPECHAPLDYMTVKEYADEQTFLR